MTDQLTPPNPTSEDGSRLAKAKSEIMAGGAVTENLTDDELAGGWQGALSMAAIVALFAWLGFVNFWMFVFVVGVVFSIFMHELGHYLTAKWTGMKVTQFFLFFGPRLWSFRRGETEYGVRALPLGAFVRIIGMNRMDEVDPADEARTYRQKSFPRRLLVISAGSITHVLIAILLVFGVYMVQGKPTGTVEERVIVTAADVALPAGQAGIRPGDQILAIDGEPLTTTESMGETIRSYDPADQVDVLVLRDGAEQTISVGLGARADVPATDELFGTAYLGVSSTSPQIYENLSIPAAAGSAVTDLFPLAWESTQGVVKVLNPVNIVTHLNGTNDDPSSRPTTLYGVARVSDDVGEDGGWAGALWLLAFLNVFVGVFNMFPLLPLDGGHAAIAAYERVREGVRGGRQRYFADVERLMPLAMGVVIVLVVLMFTGLYLDITEPI